MRPAHHFFSARPSFIAATRYVGRFRRFNCQACRAGPRGIGWVFCIVIIVPRAADQHTDRKKEDVASPPRSASDPAAMTIQPIPRCLLPMPKLAPFRRPGANAGIV
jgi:hypothetical protein